MQWDVAITGLVALGLLVYLAFSLLSPERF